MYSINDRFRIVFKESGLSQEKFADKIKRSRGELANIIYDKTVPKDKIIEATCEVFEINESWLRYGTGEMRAETTQKQKLARFFADVLASAPDDRSAFISALADLPPEFWPLVVELAKNITAGIKKEED